MVISYCGSPVSSISWHDRLWGSQHSPSLVGCLCKKKHTMSLISLHHKNSKLYRQKLKKPITYMQRARIFLGFSLSKIWEMDSGNFAATSKIWEMLRGSEVHSGGAGGRLMSCQPKKWKNSWPHRILRAAAGSSELRMAADSTRARDCRRYCIVNRRSGRAF